MIQQNDPSWIWDLSKIKKKTNDPITPVQSQTNNWVPTPDTPMSEPTSPVAPVAPVITPATPVAPATPVSPTIVTPVITPSTPAPTIVDNLASAQNGINQVTSEAINQANDKSIKDLIKKQELNAIQQGQLDAQLITYDQKKKLADLEMEQRSTAMQQQINDTYQKPALDTIQIASNRQQEDANAYILQRDESINNMKNLKDDVSRLAEIKLEEQARLSWVGLSNSAKMSISTMLSATKFWMEKDIADYTNKGYSQASQLLSISQNMAINVYDTAEKYWIKTSKLYEDAQNAKNMIAYLKETNPITYNQKVLEINDRVMEKIKWYEKSIQTDVDGRVKSAQTAVQAVQATINANQTIVQRQVDADIANGNIYRIPESELIKTAQLLGTTPAGLRAKADGMIDSAIGKAIADSGRLFSAQQVASFTAQARAMVRSGISPDNAITQVLQWNNIMKPNEIQVWGGLYDRNTNKFTDIQLAVTQSELSKKGTITQFDFTNSESEKFANIPNGWDTGYECWWYAARRLWYGSMSAMPEFAGNPDAVNTLSGRREAFTSKSPTVGAMVFFDPSASGYPADNKFGHIAVVTKVNADGSIEIEDSNYAGDNKKRVGVTIPANQLWNASYINGTPLAKDKITQNTVSTPERQSIVVQYGNTPAVRNFNPWNIKDKWTLGNDAKWFAIFATPQEWFNALVSQLENIQAGNSATYWNNPTVPLDDYIYKYAPSSENDTEKYLNWIMKELWITDRTTALNQIDANKLALAHAKFKDIWMYNLLKWQWINKFSLEVPKSQSSSTPTGGTKTEAQITNEIQQLQTNKEIIDWYIKYKGTGTAYNVTWPDGVTYDLNNPLQSAKAIKLFNNQIQNDIEPAIKKLEALKTQLWQAPAKIMWTDTWTESTISQQSSKSLDK